MTLPSADDWNGVKSKIEALHSMGRPACDICRDMSGPCPDFWPDNPVIIIDTEGETLAEWKNKTLCQTHRNGTTAGNLEVETTVKPVEKYKHRYQFEVTGIRKR